MDVDKGDTAGSPPRHLKCLRSFRFGHNPGHLFAKSGIQANAPIWYNQ